MVPWGDPGSRSSSAEGPVSHGRQDPRLILKSVQRQASDVCIFEPVILLLGVYSDEIM